MSGAFGGRFVVCAALSEPVYRQRALVDVGRPRLDGVDGSRDLSRDLIMSDSRSSNSFMPTSQIACAQIGTSISKLRVAR